MGSIFFAPLSGLTAAYSRVNAIANNIANINTTGYHGETPTSMDLSPLGTALQSLQRSGQTGFFFQTGSPLDMALSGDSFFQVRTRDGGTAYTRDGHFHTDSQGNLVNASGAALEPPVKLPAGAQGAFVGQDGRVTAIVDGQTQEVGRVQVTRFNNPEGLQSIGQNLFVETSASGSPSAGYPGDGAFPKMFTGYLEGSNVDLSSQIVQLSLEKTSIEADVRALRVADEIAQESLRIGQK